MSRTKAVWIAAIIAVLVILRWELPGHHLIARLVETARTAGTLGVLLFTAFVVFATLALLPSAVLTLAAGLAYGTLRGVLVAWPAATFAAGLAFLLGRTVLKDWAAARTEASAQGRAINRVIRRETFKLVFLLRLSPFVPFNVLNYALGAADVSARRFVAASALGMFPELWLFVYLGSRMSHLAGGIAAARAGHGELHEWHLLFDAVGVAATIVFVLLAARIAARAIARELEAQQEADGQAGGGERRD